MLSLFAMLEMKPTACHMLGKSSLLTYTPRPGKITLKWPIILCWFWILQPSSDLKPISTACLTTTFVLLYVIAMPDSTTENKAN